jgi:hypothetical protein
MSTIADIIPIRSHSVTMKPLSPSEHDLVGKWITIRGRVQGDEVTNRIEWLISDLLDKIGPSVESGGWDILYRDPGDGRYWELTYPEGYKHGGGPPRLTCLSQAVAKRKYANILRDERGTRTPMSHIELVAALEKEWNQPDGFFGKLRIGVFDQAGLNRVEALLKGVDLPDSTEIDRRLVSLTWYIPLFISWQAQRIRENGGNVTALLSATTKLQNLIEHVLGVP